MSSSDILNLALTWGTPGSNNGNLSRQITVTSDPLNVTQNYTYDAYNRLLTSVEGSSWKQSYDYDALGNRWLDSNSANTFGITLSPFTATGNGNQGQTRRFLRSVPPAANTDNGSGATASLTLNCWYCGGLCYGVSSSTSRARTSA
jgi:hypothetical protein